MSIIPSQRVTAETTAETSTATPFTGTDILGVASRYNAFAAGKLIISSPSGNTGSLEGRYAAGEILDKTAGRWNSDAVWGSVTETSDGSVLPLLTTNLIERYNADGTTESNIFQDVYKQQGSGTDFYNHNNQLVANNLETWRSEWSNTEKEKYQHLDHILQTTKVGQTPDFKKNQDILQSLLT